MSLQPNHNTHGANRRFSSLVNTSVVRIQQLCEVVLNETERYSNEDTQKMKELDDSRHEIARLKLEIDELTKKNEDLNKELIITKERLSMFELKASRETHYHYSPYQQQQHQSRYHRNQQKSNEERQRMDMNQMQLMFQHKQQNAMEERLKMEMHQKQFIFQQKQQEERLKMEMNTLLSRHPPHQSSSSHFQTKTLNKNEKTVIQGATEALPTVQSFLPAMVAGYGNYPVFWQNSMPMAAPVTSNPLAVLIPRQTQTATVSESNGLTVPQSANTSAAPDEQDVSIDG